eukprot:TRINITY_DN5606_c0_g1_i1.p1 TRINITY_DN5606_c0_g1~~TRINITY_DN5606_c0_g1_i1.p1  ORF type:complete len:234 (+),score=87.22 TRINITY_DN5606_c0_g1_i1:353-1054(+)
MDSRDGNVQQSHPTFCRNGCGFYSTAGNEGLCSVCYKEHVKKKQAPPTNMPASLAPTPGTMASLSIEEGSAAAAAANPAAPGSPLASNSAAANNTSGAVGGGMATGAGSIETAGTTVPCAGLIQQKDVDCGTAAGGAAGSSSPMAAASPITSAMDAMDNGGDKDGASKKKKNRCLSCKKKVGLTGFTCRCGGLFCSIHRYSDKHECAFDYKALGAEEISKSNPVVVAEKVAKI